MIDNILMIYDEELFADAVISIINTINQKATIDKISINDNLDEINFDCYELIIFFKEDTKNIENIYKKVRKLNLGANIAIFSRSFSNDDIKYYEQYNMNALIYKKYQAKKIDNIMRLIMMGENYYPSELLSNITNPILSKQQLKLVNYLRYGYSNKQIAYEMGLTEATIKTHMTHILKRLGVTNRTQVVRKAFDMGLIQY